MTHIRKEKLDKFFLKTVALEESRWREDERKYEWAPVLSEFRVVNLTYKHILYVRLFKNHMIIMWRNTDVLGLNHLGFIKFYFFDC